MADEMDNGVHFTATEFVIDVARLVPDAGVAHWSASAEAHADSLRVLQNPEKAAPTTFKNEDWRESTRSNLPKTGTGRGGGWKGTKQLAQLEQQQLPHTASSYLSIQAGESTRCPSRACDVTGAPAALYRDGRSKLRYASAALRPHVEAMPDHVAAKYEELRTTGKLVK